MGRPKKEVKKETPKPEVKKAEVKSNPVVNQRYFRVDRVEEKKKEGWKVVDNIKDETMKKIINRNQDLILMEK